jgi:adenylyltransferase/sulfurtransferase
LYGKSSLGINKAIAAKKRLQDLNDSICIHTYPHKLNSTNALKLFEAYDIVVDGTDNFEARYLICDASIISNKPVVFGSIYKFEGQVSVFNLENGPTYRCLFPEPPLQEDAPNCSETGVIGVLPGIICSLQENETLKIILELGSVFSGQLYCYNSKTNESQILFIKKNEKKIKEIKEMSLKEMKHQKCEQDSFVISIEDALKKDNSIFLDVRDLHEKPIINIQNYQHIPLIEIPKSLDKINAKKDIIVICQTGIRSKNAVKILRDNSFKKSYSLSDGAAALLRQLKKQNNGNIKN